VVGAGGRGGAGRLEIRAGGLDPIGSYDVAAALASSGAVVEMNIVPEPSGLLLASLGLTGLLMLTARRRAACRETSRPVPRRLAGR
jgi:hypothetical protein